MVNQDDLGAVGHDAYLLYEDLQAGADIAGAGANKEGVGTSSQAATALKANGFATGGALETTVEIWTSQLKTVLQACATSPTTSTSPRSCTPMTTPRSVL